MNDGAPPPDGPGVPHRDLDVPPARVRGPRGGGRAGIAVLAGIAVVIAAAIGAAQLAPPRPPSATSASGALMPRSGAPTPAPPVGASTPAGPGTQSVPVPDASAILAGTPPRFSLDRLGAGVRDGSLEGRLVFVDGFLRATPVPCLDPAREPLDCVELEIAGLGLPVSPDEGTIPWPGDPPSGAWLVTVAHGGGLVYLGSLVPWTGQPRSLTSVRALLMQRGGAPPHGTLFEVDGYLVPRPFHTCFRPGVEATPCPPFPPFLAEQEPPADGILVTEAGEEVILTGPVPGADQLAAVTPGTFLVAPEGAGGGPWRIVARYEPPRSVRVLAP